MLIFKALGLAGCETHPIQQAGHFSGFIQGFRICGGSWIAGVSPAEHGTCSFLRPLALLDARRIQSSKQAISAEFNKSVQQISSTNQAFIVGGENWLSVQINSS
ncbi:MAG: hypothetical protein PHY24_08195 [Candidatus Cloacimonetes bacterium]|nr:hypothetical protein [Candidatus Cloacimonadota bacterium]